MAESVTGTAETLDISSLSAGERFWDEFYPGSQNGIAN